MLINGAFSPQSCSQAAVLCSGIALFPFYLRPKAIKPHGLCFAWAFRRRLQMAGQKGPCALSWICPRSILQCIASFTNVCFSKPSSLHRGSFYTDDTNPASTFLHCEAICFEPSIETHPSILTLAEAVQAIDSLPKRLSPLGSSLLITLALSLLLSSPPTSFNVFSL